MIRRTCEFTVYRKLGSAFGSAVGLAMPRARKCHQILPNAASAMPLATCRTLTTCSEYLGERWAAFEALAGLIKQIVEESQRRQRRLNRDLLHELLLRAAAVSGVYARCAQPHAWLKSANPKEVRVCIDGETVTVGVGSVRLVAGGPRSSRSIGCCRRDVCQCCRDRSRRVAVDQCHHHFGCYKNVFAILQRKGGATQCQ